MTASVVSRPAEAAARVAPRCDAFGRCGGCSLQDVAYAAQLAMKRQWLRGVLAAAGVQADPEVTPLPEPWRYRNKAEMSFGVVDGRLVLGYHEAGSFWRIAEVRDCWLLPESANQVLRTVEALARDTGLPPYQHRTHQGWFRYAILRRTRHEAMQVCLMTASGHESAAVALLGEVMRRHPAVRSLYWAVSDRPADVARPDQLRHVAGEPYLEETLGSFRVPVHPFSFLQPSTEQAHVMYAALASLAQAGPHDTAWDVYCGIGLIGCYLARHARTVYGIDVEPWHVDLARDVARRNGLANLQFKLGQAEDVLMDRRFWLGSAKPDVVVVDPPRAGLQARVMSSILAAKPARIGYLSCNAEALARDLGVLLHAYPRYAVRHVAAYDQFAHTRHVETLVWLERVKR